MRKFCFLCGKETRKLIESYCEECYNKKFSLIKIPKNISFIVCTKCERVNFQNKWLDSAIEDIIRKKVKIIGKDVSITVKRNDDFQIIAEGYLEGVKTKKKEVHDVDIDVKKTVCQICSRRFGGYYETKIQLRGDYEEILDFIDDEIRRYAIKDPKVFYRLETTKNGVDLFVSSRQIANTISQKVKKIFNVKLTKSRKLITKKQGRNIYRDVIAIRI